MMSWKGFSQTGTDTTSIRILKPVAREIIKDLLLGDVAKEQVLVLEEINSVLSYKASTQTTLINNLNNQIANYKTIIVAKDYQIENHIKISETYRRAYLKENRSKRIWRVATVLALGTAVLISK